jgi:telomerase protein component 1
LSVKIAQSDPEFILKLSMYVRHVLNIRATANFLLAVAALLQPCQPFFLKWLRHVIRLPSDWKDVPVLYEKLVQQQQMLGGVLGSGMPAICGEKCVPKASIPLPAALRKALVRKFSDFDAFTISKYNKGKKTNKRKGKGPPAVSLKQMVMKLHIARPAQIILSLLGKRYPKNPADFAKSGLPGKFDATQGMEQKRMKLPLADTWEVRVSKYGNIARTWEALIDINKLPFMAMMRNISNLLRAGVRRRYHEWVWKQLTNQRAVARSRQLPFQFLSAFEAIDAVKKKIDADKTYAEMQKQYAPKPNPADKKKKKKKRNKNVVVFPDESVYEKYRDALDTAMKLATVNNCSPIEVANLLQNHHNH